MTVERIIEVLRPLRLPLNDEKRLQVDIAVAFDGAGIVAEREVRLGDGDIIDFVAGEIGVEIKIKGGKRAIYRQLERYCAHDQIGSILLVTNVPMGLPAEIRGKPAYLFNLAMAWI